ncbi:MAG: methylenetetrahydrofolate reductase [Thermodesulfobacteriota bacterium]
MRSESTLANKIKAGEFIVTAELLPRASADGKTVEESTGFFDSRLTAVNVADNPHGPVMSSLAASVILSRAGREPIYQVVTRDRNRIALQSDLLGAAALGIRNILCLSGHHQALTDSRESANVYDIDSIQLVAAVRKMCADGILLDGTRLQGEFSALVGAVVSPDMKPMELNLIRLAKKVEAGARFIQTQAVFDLEQFDQWLSAARDLGITRQTAILAGVFPISSAEEAEHLRAKYMDLSIPDSVIARLKAAGDEAAQKKEGLSICVETIQKIKTADGVRGIHLLSGGRENRVPEIMAAAGL